MNNNCANKECFSFQHVVASVDNNCMKLYKAANMKCDAIIANQNKQKELIEAVKTKFGNLKIVNTLTVGVGKNRNIGFLFSSSDICILGDDDMVYKDDYLEKISAFFKDRADVDVAIFDIEVVNPRVVPKPITRVRKLNRFNYMKYGGSRFVFKRESIINKDIKFTELFGGGARFSSGEDTIFIHDCLKNGLNVYAVPEVIATVDCGVSSWFRGANERFFYDKGALFRRVSSCLWIFLIIRFAIRTKTKLSYYRRIKMMMLGAKGYCVDMSYNDYCENVIRRQRK